MKTNDQDQMTLTGLPQGRTSGFFGEVRAFLSKDGEYLTILLPGNMAVRKHVNFFKAVMGLPFSPKKTSVAEAAS